MGLAIQWDGGEKLLNENETVIIGRDPNSDIHISNNRISRYHLRIHYYQNRWVASDLRSSNQSFCNAKPFSEIEIQDGLEISLGGINNYLLSFRVLNRSKSNLKNSGKSELVESSVLSSDSTSVFEIDKKIRQNKIDSPFSVEVTGKKRITLNSRFKIGRDSGNDLVLNDLLVSRNHCELVSNNRGTHDLVDLSSSNGVFINGVRTQRKSLNKGDIISIGAFSVRYVGTALESLDVVGGYSFEAKNISVVINGKKLLDDVSFAIEPRSLTAVIGPSGAGKSTLLNALTGRRRAENGTINFAGRNLYTNYDELRNRIGLVPQSDLLHSNLTTEMALKYGAALRFPKDTSEQERHLRVKEVMDELGLSERALLRIDKLSGGQRKRTSVALELLTQPSLLFLDEPTSGLDPGLDRQVMGLLRNLANDGRTVIVVTHSVSNLDVCDNVLVMAPGGKVAYFGPPSNALQFFKAKDWAEVFDKLNSDSINSWSSQTSTQLRNDNFESKNEVPELKILPQQSWIFQLKILSSRYLHVILADKQFTLFLFALPILLSIVGYLSGDSSGLSANESTQILGVPPNPQARTLLLVLILGTTFMGTASSIQELVKERVIFERERSIGLSKSAYIMSKFLVLGSITISQAIVFSTLTLAGRSSPSNSLLFGNSYLEILFLLCLLAFISMALGLAISALINTTEVGMPALVVTTVAQVILSGAVPLRFESILEVAGIPNPAYWVMNSLAATTDLSYLIGDNSNSNWEPSKANWIYSTSVSAAFLFALFTGAHLALSRRESK